MLETLSTKMLVIERYLASIERLSQGEDDIILPLLLQPGFAPPYSQPPLAQML